MSKLVSRHPVLHAESHVALDRRGAVLQPECDELHAVRGIDHPPGANVANAAVGGGGAAPLGLVIGPGGPLATGPGLWGVRDMRRGRGAVAQAGRSNGYVALL